MRENLRKACTEHPKGSTVLHLSPHQMNYNSEQLKIESERNRTCGTYCNHMEK